MEHGDVAVWRLRGGLAQPGMTAKIDVFGQRGGQVFRPHPGGHPIVVAQVEARPAVQPVLGNPLALLLLDALAFGGDAAVLALAVVAEAVELALEPMAPVAVVLVLDPLSQLALARALLEQRQVRRRAGVVAEGPEAAA